MNTQQLISLIGIIVALSLLIWMIMKGVNIFITVFISCAIVAITTLGFVADEKVGPLTMFNAYKTFFIRGFVGFFSANYLIFLTGTLMGKLMEITNGAKAIAKLIIKIFGKKYALISVPLSCAVLAYGGVTVFVVSFAVFPIALEIFREADLPRRFLPGALTFGCSTFAMVAPGAPQIHNFTPSTVMTQLAGRPVTLMAGTIVGFLSCGAIFVLGALFMFWYIDKARKNGEHFVAKDIDKFEVEGELPSGILSLVPLVVTIFIINLKVGGKNIVQPETGVLFGTILTWLLLNKYQDNHKVLGHVGDGCKAAIGSICNTCAVVGFGTLVSMSAAFPVVRDAMTSIPGPPLVGVAVGTTVIAGICGSASGALGIAAPLLGPVYLAKGVSAEAISRTMSISSAALDSLPHNGYIVTVTNGICNETHKDAYGLVFWLTVFMPAVGSVICVILFSLFPNWP